MPLPVDVKHGTHPSLRGRIGRWLRRPAPPAHVSRDAPDAPADVATIERSYWDVAQTSERRIAALVAAHDRDGGRRSRPRGNPAFAEALFVELMRARQYRRAYEQLSDECKRRWGSAEAFATAQGSGALRCLQGVKVKDVRFLAQWHDPDAGRTYEDVAELDVEYALGNGAASRAVPRVVHLVPGGGKWRSVCHPAGAG